jgi:ABC-2 type transport system ATP-binding protein
MQLTISNLSKTYPNGTRALKRVSLTIAPGMFGLVGPNGAGKSTLMRTIATLQEADEGSIRLDDIDVLKDKDAVRRILGYLPQEFGVYPQLTAIDLLDHLAVMKGITARGDRRDTVDALLHQTNLHEVRKVRLGAYSGGMKQRFGIAQALLGHPKLLIVDEPTAGLDPSERNRFLNLLASIGEEVIVILSTHIVADVAELCSQMAIIDKGEVLMEGQPQEAVAAIRGTVWKKTIARRELADYQRRYDVLSTHLAAGRTEIRVVKAETPGDLFAPVDATLEDLYFATLGRGHRAPARV